MPIAMPGYEALLAAIGQAVRFVAGTAERLPWIAKRGKPRYIIRRATAPMRDALECVPIAIVGVGQSGTIGLANAKAAELFGYRCEELIGAPTNLLLPELGLTDLLAAADSSRMAQETMATPTPQALTAKRRDGTEFPAEVTTSECDVDGAPTQLAVIVDRSERSELHRNRQELTHLTRISALGELAASLAHELNQPLTAILSNSQAAQRFMDADPINVPEVRETLRDIVADNCRASEIIRKMRALVRKGDVELQPLDVGNVVRDVVLLVHSDAIMRGIRTRLEIPAKLPPVRGDKVQLQQVVLNLLLNAFDAMHECLPADRVVEVQIASKPGEMVRIAVRDRGTGLTVDQMDKIFKPFFTSKPHGLGLGLSISRSIVAAHGGRLWAENNDGRGASFYVSLPAEDMVGPTPTPT
jgi:two-component system, LuxR family, sensor kinase FixL